MPPMRPFYGGPPARARRRTSDEESVRRSRRIRRHRLASARGDRASRGNRSARPPVGWSRGLTLPRRLFLVRKCAVNPYTEAGVDTAAGDLAVELMKSAVRRTHGPEVLGGVGGFAGLFDASALRTYARPLLATSTDGVGTKVAIAQAIDKHDTIGLDLVGMVVDDIVVVGAQAALHDRLHRVRQGLPRAHRRHRRAASRAAAPRPAPPSSAARPPSTPDSSASTTTTSRAPRPVSSRPTASSAPTACATGDVVLALAIERTALERLLARAAHRHARRHPVRRQRRRLRHDVGRGAARAHPPLHRAAAAPHRRPRTTACTRSAM